MPDSRRRSRRPRTRPYACPASESSSAGADTRPTPSASERPLTVRLPEGPPRLSPDAAKVLLRILLDAAQPDARQPAASLFDPADPDHSPSRCPAS